MIKLSVGMAEFKNDLIYFVFCWFLLSYYFLYIIIDKMLGIFPNAQTWEVSHSGSCHLGKIPLDREIEWNGKIV